MNNPLSEAANIYLLERGFPVSGTTSRGVVKIIADEIGLNNLEYVVQFLKDTHYKTTSRSISECEEAIRKLNRIISLLSVK